MNMASSSIYLNVSLGIAFQDHHADSQGNLVLPLDEKLRTALRPYNGMMALLPLFVADNEALANATLLSYPKPDASSKIITDV